MASLDDDRFLVLPHPEVAGYYAARAADTDRWLAGMRRLRQKVDASLRERLPGLDLDAFRAWYDGERPGEIAGDLSGRG